MILGRDTISIRVHEVTSENGVEIRRKQQKYVMKFKQTAWKRFHHEYLVAIRERHNLYHKKATSGIQVGDEVIIKGEEDN